MTQLTHIEKIILATIMKGYCSLLDIHNDTQIQPIIIKKTILQLEGKELIHCKNNIFYARITARHSALWTPNKMEVLSLVDKAYHKKDNFKFTLASFREKDFQEYLHLSKRLHYFIKDCNKQNRIRSCDQRYIFWGQLPQRHILH